MAMRIFDVAFDALFQDVRILVAEGVRKDIKLSLAAASQQNLKAVSSRSKKREASLKAWLKKAFPLAYGDKDGAHDTFDLLVEAVVREEYSVSSGLPGWDANSKTPFNFVLSLLNMSSPTNPAPPSAPVLSDGAFLPVLKVAHTSLLSLVKDRSDDVAKQSFLRRTFRNALIVFKVNYFPHHKDNAPTRGARHRVPIYNSWGHLGSRDPSDPFRSLGDPAPSLPQVPLATVAYNNAVANDCNAPWSAKPLDLKALKHYLNRTTLPLDFVKPSPSKAPYVNLTYHWVKENYTGTNHIHHLALLVSIIASSLLPRFFPPDNAKELLLAAHDRKLVREAYNAMDWVAKPKGGMSDRSIFISMITTFIIALYEHESPLREHMRNAPKRGLGNDWTYKYSEPLPLSPLSFFMSIFLLFVFFLFQGVKGITYGLLIRLGVLWGKGSKAVDSGMFDTDWGCYPLHVMEDMYTRLCSALKSGDIYAPFDALSILIGPRNARIFCKDHLNLYYKSYPTPSSSYASASTSASNHDDSNSMMVDT